MKASELFVISALILLVFALVGRFISSSGLGIAIPFRGTGYVLPPSTICVGLATAKLALQVYYSRYEIEDHAGSSEVLQATGERGWQGPGSPLWCTKFCTML